MIELSAMIADILGSGAIAIAIVSLLSCVYLAKRLTPKNKPRN
jgi:hypothetical protein